jgi:hypothetical protein
MRQYVCHRWLWLYGGLRESYRMLALLDRRAVVRI